MASKRGRGGGARKAAAKVEVFRLRMAGASFREIAAEVGVSTTYAFKLYRDELDARAAEAGELADRERIILSERLEAVILAHWGNLHDPQSAKVVLAALDRKAKLFGLDAPTKVEHSGSVEHSHESEAERTQRLIAETAEQVAAMTPEQVAAEFADLTRGDA
jgi:hypothetical protein